MSPQRPLTTSLTLSLTFLFLFLSLTTTSHAHNITKILASHPEFSTFNHYLTLTHLATDINRRQTITVLALDNGAMSSLLDKHLSIYTLKNVLSLHVLVDYFGAHKLHQITNGTTLTSSVFQSSGSAPGSSGYVNITDLKGGKVAFGTEDNDGRLNSRFVKSVKEIPYNISILQITQALTSSEAEAPTPEPSQLNLTVILAKQGCKSFADSLIATGTQKTFQNTIDGGLTVFCPSDAVIKSFTPKYKNLTTSQKVSLLLYHGIPVYQSLQMLKSNNGVSNTLATEKANKYEFTVQTDGDDVTLETNVVTAKITGTVIDEEPLVVYKINKVLQPKELFKVTLKKADAPKPEEEADAPSPEADSDDQTADDNDSSSVVGSNGRRYFLVVLSFCMGILFL